MSLRDLARAYLDAERRRISAQACPVSGRLGVSGPDKTTQPLIVLRGEPVRMPSPLWTQLDPSDRPSGPDKNGRSGHPDRPDASDKPDASDAMASVERLLAQMARENERRSDWWRHPPEGWTEGKLVLRSILTGESEVIGIRKRRFDS